VAADTGGGTVVVVVAPSLEDLPSPVAGAAVAFVAAEGFFAVVVA